MALLRCPECGHAVSEQAVKCPNCGCPVRNTAPQSEQYRPSVPPQSSPAHGQTNYAEPEVRYDHYRADQEQNKSSTGKIIALVLLILMVIGGACFAVWYITHSNNNDQPKEETKTEQQQEDQQMDQQQNTDQNTNDQLTDQQEDTDQQIDQDNEENYHEPAEDGGTDDEGAKGGQDVTNDNP